MRRSAGLFAIAWIFAGPVSAQQQLAGAASVQSDPLQSFYGNTVVCLAAAGGQDLCHQWFNPDGTFINIDGGGAHTGHYVVSAPRPDGKVQMCLYFDSAQDIAVPRAADAGPPPGAPGRAAGLVVVCRQKDFKTTCERNVDPKTVAPADQQHITRSAGDAFYKGMCYPMGRHAVGDVWFETDDPMPRELGTDKLMLLGGRQ